MKTVSRILACAGFLCATTVCQAGGSDPLEDLLSATFKIFQNDHAGSCFLLTDHRADPANQRHVILATAAHVLEQMIEAEAEVVLRTGNLQQGFHRKQVGIKIRDGEKPLWKRHPEMDVAVLPIEIPEDLFVKPIAVEQLASEAQLSDRTVHVGQETWISCFPAKLEANETGWPVLRRGSIATFPLIPVKTAKTILIDYTVFGGDSGAPVAVIRDGKLLIVGVAASMQRQTDKSTLPFEERTMHMPMGLSIAIQAVYLRETIDLLSAK